MRRARGLASAGASTRGGVIGRSGTRSAARTMLGPLVVNGASLRAGSPLSAGAGASDPGAIDVGGRAAIDAGGADSAACGLSGADAAAGGWSFARDAGLVVGGTTFTGDLGS